MKKTPNYKNSKVGNVELRSFELSEDDARMARVRSWLNGDGRCGIVAGTYWKLLRNGELWMSNTPDELNDANELLYKAEGNVLIAGLGMGIIPWLLMQRGKVKKITIVEIDKDVIELISPYLKGLPVEIIEGSIFDFKPKQHYDWGWFDIWQDISAENRSEYVRLRRKFKPHCTNILFWCDKEVKRLAREQREEERIEAMIKF